MTANVSMVTYQDGRKVTLSYGVPVAVYVPPGYGSVDIYRKGGHYRTDKAYSVTSSRHANLYARQNGVDRATMIPHAAFVNLVSPIQA